MRAILASLILNEAGLEITKQSISELIRKAGAEPQDDEVENFLTKLDGKNIQEAIAEGLGMMQSVESRANPAAKEEEVEVEEKSKEPPKPADTDVDLFDIF
ncbi:60S acidic ribosomal protein P2 [Trachipleistophora hominis]|uniref:60S acidic ribosomal protein P2 n=1 Tax=Trachipleistophora hominis TaxID=72359 RepID=L7JTI6_TRAHO|nr:60S acidic ribosomal protein P2 [Trachipleistophora hominis]